MKGGSSLPPRVGALTPRGFAGGGRRLRSSPAPLHWALFFQLSAFSFFFAGVQNLIGKRRAMQNHTAVRGHEIGTRFRARGDACLGGRFQVSSFRFRVFGLHPSALIPSSFPPVSAACLPPSRVKVCPDVFGRIAQPGRNRRSREYKPPRVGALTPRGF